MICATLSVLVFVVGLSSSQSYYPRYPSYHNYPAYPNSNGGLRVPKYGPPQSVPEQPNNLKVILDLGSVRTVCFKVIEGLGEPIYVAIKDKPSSVKPTKPTPSTTLAPTTVLPSSPPLETEEPESVSVPPKVAVEEVESLDDDSNEKAS